MKNKECEIIKDLLPSYVDEICSEASKEWIEEHLAGCEDCKRTVEMLKNTEISSRRLELESLDAGRKVIRQNLRRGMVSLGLCFLMLLTIFFVLNYEGYYGRVSMPVLYIVLPVCMAMTWLVSRNQTKLRPVDKWDIGSAAGALVGMGYGIIIMFYAMHCINNGNLVFGLPVGKTGPAINGRLMLILVLCFGLYLVQMVRTIKQGRAGSVAANVCLSGVFLMLGYGLYLMDLSDFEVMLWSLRSLTLLMLAIGAVGTVIFAVIDKFSRK